MEEDCKASIPDGEGVLAEVDVGGPTDGCSEWAEEYHLVRICKVCEDLFGALNAILAPTTSPPIEDDKVPFGLLSGLKGDND